jgi:hypothetical protein
MSAPKYTPVPWHVLAVENVGLQVYFQRPGGNRESIASVTGARREADAALICAAPDLLALARQYAMECGECAGTRVCRDGSPCTECAYVWAVIDRAEGRS